MRKRFMPLQQLIAWCRENQVTSHNYGRMRPADAPAFPEKVYPDWPGWRFVTGNGKKRTGPNPRVRRWDAVRFGECHDGPGSVIDGLCPACDRQVREIVAEFA